MRNLILSFFILLFPVLSFSQNDNLVRFGDPFIMLYQGVYYAYGTSTANQGIEVLVSDDLNEWSRPESTRLALKKQDSWGDKGFWAPEVYFVNGKFHMYYTANERVCVAVSDSPLGPFTQQDQKPIIADEQCIDNSLFVDSDGKGYMFFDRFNDGLNIWVAEMNDDLTEIIPSTMTKCITTSQEWELKQPRIIEGSFVMRYGDKYYMTYSGNNYQSHYYGIGLAIADSVYGPWVKYDKNPIYQMPGDLVGIGHSAMFKDKQGNLRVVFHAHYSHEQINPRSMHISTVNFVEDNGMMIMSVGPEYITPIMKQ